MTNLKKLGLATLVLNLSLMFSVSTNAKELVPLQDKNSFYASAKLHLIIPTFNLGYKINDDISVEVGGNPFSKVRNEYNHYGYPLANKQNRYQERTHGFYNAVVNYKATHNPKFNLIINVGAFYIPIKETINGVVTRRNGLSIDPGVAVEYAMTKNVAINFGLQMIRAYDDGDNIPMPTLGLTYKFN